MAYFDTGLLVIQGQPIKIQEITVDASRDLSPIYSSDSKDPDEIRDGRKTVNFTIKRALDHGRMSEYYERGCEFTIILYNNDVKPPQKVMTLERCKLGKDSIGNFDGSDAVIQDLDGQATIRKNYLKDARRPPVNVC